MTSYRALLVWLMRNRVATCRILLLLLRLCDNHTRSDCRLVIVNELMATVVPCMLRRSSCLTCVIVIVSVAVHGYPMQTVVVEQLYTAHVRL